MNLRRPELTTSQIPGVVVMVAKSVYDAFYKREIISSAYSMKTMLWVSSEAQLADGLTKSSAQDFIR